MNNTNLADDNISQNRYETILDLLLYCQWQANCVASWYQNEHTKHHNQSTDSHVGVRTVHGTSDVSILSSYFDRLLTLEATIDLVSTKLLYWLLIFFKSAKTICNLDMVLY